MLDMPKILSRVWSILIQVCILGFFASLLYFSYLSGVSPTSPVISTGQTVELNNHGSLFYVRFWDAIFAQSGFAFVGTVLVGAALLQWRYGTVPDVASPDIVGYFLVASFAAMAIYIFWVIF